MGWVEDALMNINTVLAEWEGIKQRYNITDEIIEKGREILEDGNNTKP